MKAIVNNDKIKIESVEPAFKARLMKALSYTDTAKQWQLRRMAKNPFLKKSVAYKALEGEVYGCLMEESGSDLIILSGFSYLLKNIDYEDHRCDTGVNISLPWKTKPFDLRDYQTEAVSLMMDNFRGLINFATGLGKTLTAVHAIRKLKKKTLVLCPGVSIADNFYAELVSAFGEDKVGYYGDGKKKIKDITVGIAASVNNNIQKFIDHDFGVMIVDEVHHIPATTFYTIAENLGSIGRIYGLTATDFRADGKDVMITAGVGEALISRDLIWGIKNKWLRDPYIIMRDVHTHGRDHKGDKIKNYKEHVLHSLQMNEQIEGDIKKFLAAGLSVLCLVDQVAHGEQLAKAVGLPFATGTNKGSKQLVSDLNKKSIPGLIGTAKYIGEGTDTKNVDVIVLANFVAGKGSLWQNLGRGLRPFEGKMNLIVLDYVPLGSSMLSRHAKLRLKMYKEITCKIKEC